jgi:hypothetical protein
MEIGRIFGIALALMFGGIVITGVYTLNEQGLEPAEKNVRGQLNQTGPSTVTIGAPPNDSPEEARKQMEALIVWNAMASSNCRVLMAGQIIDNIKWGEEGFNEFEPIESPDERVLKIDDADEWLSDYRGSNKNGIYGFEGGFDPLVEGEFTKKCLGAKSIMQEIENDVQDSISDAASSLLGGIGGLTGLGVQIVTGGVLLTAVDYAIDGDTIGGSVGDTVGNWAGRTIVPGATRNFAREVGFDMEGKYGRVNFEVNRTFHMGEMEEYPEPIIGFNFKADDGEGNKPNWKSNTPGFWRGKRFMYAVPPGLVPKGSHGFGCCSLEPDSPGDWEGPFDGISNFEGYGDGRKKIRTFYAWRVRMIREERLNDEDFYSYNIPLAADGELDLHKNNFNHPKVNMIRYLLRNTEWIMCRGAEGYVQSNAYKMFNDGEVQKTNSKKEDNVYPMVKITEGATDCLEPDSGTTLDEVSGVSTGGNLHDELQEKFYTHWPEKEIAGLDFLNCNEADHVGKGDRVFARKKADGGIFKTWFQCGGSQKHAEISPTENWYGGGGAGPYSDHIWYYTPKFKIQGCSPAHYDITRMNKASEDGEVTWKYDRPPGSNQLSIMDILIDPESFNRENSVFEVNISYSGGEDLRSVISEEYNGGDTVYKQATYRDGSLRDSGRVMPGEKEDNWRASLDLQINSIGIMEKKAYGRADSGHTLGDIGGEIDESEFGNQIQSISIGNMTQPRIEEVNEEVSQIEFGQNQGFELDEVAIHGKPRVCNKVFS